MKKFIKEFRDFIATGNMVEFAVAVVLGAAVKAVIDKIMEAVVNPLIGAIVGKPNLDSFLTITVREGSANESVISFGAVLTQVLNLVLVGVVLFLALKAYNRMRAPKDVPPPPAGPSEVELLTEIRDALRDR
jgi:large conductance mechanosensitive channel